MSVKKSRVVKNLARRTSPILFTILSFRVEIRPSAQLVAHLPRVHDKESVMEALLNRIVIYAKKVDRMAKFYETHLGFARLAQQDANSIELTQKSGGFSLLIHSAGKGVKIGQATVKLVFSVKDVEKFCAKSLQAGLRFGAVHQSDGYKFANAKDPEKNSIQISSRFDDLR